MMQEGNKKMIDDYFKEQLFDFEVTPPAGVFDKVEEALQKKKRKLWLNVTISMAASFAIIIAAGVGYVVGTRQTKPQEKVAHTTQNQQLNSIQSTALQLSNNEVIINDKNDDNLISSNSNYISEYKPTANNINLIGGKHVTAFDNSVNSDFENENVLSSNSGSNKILVALKSRSATLKNRNTSQRLAISAQSLNYLLGFESNNEVHETEEIADQPWQLGGSIAPLYSYRNIQNANSSEIFSTIESSEKPLLSYAGGLNVNYEHKRWRIETGVYYSRQGQNINDVNALKKTAIVENRYDDVKNVSVDKGPLSADVTSGSINNSSGNIQLAASNNQYYLSNSAEITYNNTNTLKNTSTSIKQQYEYVEIPFIANYKLIDKAVELSVSGGMSANIMIGNDLYLKTNNATQNIGPTEDVETFNYSGIVGLAFEIPLIRSMSVKVEPRFRYNLNSINANSDLNTHPYSFGVFSGLAYRF